MRVFYDMKSGSGIWIWLSVCVCVCVKGRVGIVWDQELVLVLAASARRELGTGDSNLVWELKKVFVPRWNG